MKTRVGRKMDMSRLSAAVKRPGVDTRCWVSLAVALGDSIIDEDGGGIFVDVLLVPTEEEYTVRVGSEYAGDGFGFYRRVREGDELLIGIPSGEASEGPVILKRLWSAADPTPVADLNDDGEGTIEDLILVVEPARNFRIKLTGGGQLRIGVGNNRFIMTEELIELGAEGAADKASRDSKVQTELKRLRSDVNGLKNTYNGHSVTVTVPAVGLLDSVGLACTGAATGTSAAPGDAAAIQDIQATNSELVTIDS